MVDNCLFEGIILIGTIDWPERARGLKGLGYGIGQTQAGGRFETGSDLPVASLARDPDAVIV